MASYLPANVTATLTNAYQSFSKIPISDYLYYGITELGTKISSSKIPDYINSISAYISPNGALYKAYEYVPLRLAAAGVAGLGLTGIALKFFHAAYKSDSMKSTMYYATAGALTTALIGFEVLKFSKVLNCFNRFEVGEEQCSRDPYEVYDECLL